MQNIIEIQEMTEAEENIYTERVKHLTNNGVSEIGARRRALNRVLAMREGE